MKKVGNTWVIEAIHHTEPISEVKALEFHYSLLNSGGYIVIYGMEGFNPLVKIK